jgi:predicted transport protein
MALKDTVEKLLAAADKLKSSGGNEANTKALLIEPLLAALGWDTADLDQVEREYRVFDGTTLDYALKVDGTPRLFVEAKAVGKRLDDKAFVSQTVNYANNEGVVWCVLTNGVDYRVYKTNEPVGMEEKLLFEIDLREAREGASTEVAHSLDLISRGALANGKLEAWGDQVFTDKRVRSALISLASKPPSELILMLDEVAGKPVIPSERISESLARILDVGNGQSPSATRRPPSPSTTSKKGAKKEFSLDHHLSGKPAAMVDLFEQIDEFGRSLGADVSRRIRKQYIAYFTGKRSFFTIEVQRQRLIVYLALDPPAIAGWNAEAMRDVRDIGHFGMGDTEFSLRTPSQVDETKNLIRQAHTQRMNAGA